jgi:hypothetical protein
MKTCSRGDLREKGKEAVVPNQLAMRSFLQSDSSGIDGQWTFKSTLNGVQQGWIIN